VSIFLQRPFLPGSAASYWLHERRRVTARGIDRPAHLVGNHVLSRGRAKQCAQCAHVDVARIQRRKPHGHCSDCGHLSSGAGALLPGRHCRCSLPVITVPIGGGHGQRRKPRLFCFPVGEDGGSTAGACRGDGTGGGRKGLTRGYGGLQCPHRPTPCLSSTKSSGRTRPFRRGRQALFVDASTGPRSG